MKQTFEFSAQAGGGITDIYDAVVGLKEMFNRYRTLCEATAKENERLKREIEILKKIRGREETMIPDETVRVYWRTPDQNAHYKDEKDIARALRLRKGFISLGREYKIAIVKQKRWVTVAESKGWKT